MTAFRGDLTGTKNGVNVAFTLPVTPVANSEQIIFSTGVLKPVSTFSGPNTLSSTGVSVTSTAHTLAVGDYIKLTAGPQTGEIRYVTAVGGANSFTINYTSSDVTLTASAIPEPAKPPATA